MEKNYGNTTDDVAVVDSDQARRESLSVPLDQVPKTKWQKLMPVFACGSGLFSDGYIQAVIGAVNTILAQIYKGEFKNSPARRNIAAIAFVGTVVGQLAFGYLSDHWSRKNSLLISTIILIVFSILSAGAYGAGGSLEGMLTALTAYRFLVGIGVGGEYPAGSVACAESTGELPEGVRNRWFIFATDLQLDIGFVFGTLVPMIVVLATTENHLRAAWRISLGIAAVPPLLLLYLRTKLKEPEEYSRQKMTKYPVWLIVKYYWFRLLVVSLIWFVYDFSTYSFSIYSTSWTQTILGDSYPLWVSLGWGAMINAFYVPGSFIGAYISDWIGPKYANILGLTLQAVIGFIMTGIYRYLDHPSHVAGFVVIYGIFLSLGEVGPGDNIGLIASKTCATAIRGQYYGIAAAMGKIGAFIGVYIFPSIVAAAGDDLIKQGQYPFYVSCSLCLFSAAITFLLPNITQNTIEEEDIKFREYLEANGYDTSELGTKEFREAVAGEAQSYK